MSISTVANGMTANQVEFARRAFALCVPCWTFDAAGTLKAGPDLLPGVQAAAVQHHHNDSAAVVTTDAGLKLLVLGEPSGATVVNLSSANAAGLSSDVLIDVLKTYHRDLSEAAKSQEVIEGFSKSLSQSYEEVNLIFLMAKELASTNEPPKVVQNICNELRSVLEFAWLAVVFKQTDRVVPALRAGVIVSGTLAFAEVQLADEAVALAALRSGRVLTPAQSRLAATAQSELLVHSVMQDDEPIALMIAGNRQGADPEISSDQIQIAGAAAQLLGLFHQNAFRFDAQRVQFMGTLHALTASVDAKDSYTRGHSERVGQLAAQLAEKLGYKADEVAAVRVSGLLHDIGKIGVAEAVLCKPARLTEDEFNLIKKHPEIGYNILKDIPSLAFHLPGVLHHHERWDGRGYPHQLKGEEIPLLARILAFADTFDAMSSNRAYRSALSRGKVLEEIRKSAGTQFDPQLVGLFVSLDFSAFDQMLHQFSSAQESLAPPLVAA